MATNNDWSTSGSSVTNDINHSYHSKSSSKGGKSGSGGYYYYRDYYYGGMSGKLGASKSGKSGSYLDDYYCGDYYHAGTSGELGNYGVILFTSDHDSWSRIYGLKPLQEGIILDSFARMFLSCL